MNNEIYERLEALRDSSRVGFLQDRANKYGDFKVFSKVGEWCTRRVSVLHCWENPNEMWRLSCSNNRTLHTCEIVIDIDRDYKKVDFMEIVHQLKKFDLYPGEVWFTGSRGLHIHIIEPYLGIIDEHNRQRIREFLISKLGGDFSLKTESHGITIENSPNAKTLQKKTLLYKW